MKVISLSNSNKLNEAYNTGIQLLNIAPNNTNYQQLVQNIQYKIQNTKR